MIHLRAFMESEGYSSRRITSERFYDILSRPRDEFTPGEVGIVVSAMKDSGVACEVVEYRDATKRKWTTLPGATTHYTYSHNEEEWPDTVYVKIGLTTRTLDGGPKIADHQSLVIYKTQDDLYPVEVDFEEDGDEVRHYVCDGINEVVDLVRTMAPSALYGSAVKRTWR
jgi:hypothetical protein